MDWVALLFTAVFLGESIYASVLLFRSRTRYNLALFTIIMVFFIITLINLLYPGKLNYTLDKLTLVFSDSPTIAKIVRKLFYITITILLFAFLLYPFVERFLIDPKSVKDPDKRDRLHRLTLRVFPRNPDLLSGYAFFLQTVRKDYDRAEAYCRKATEIDPKNAYALGVYALLLEERQDYDKAEGYYRQAVERDPKNTGILANYARFLMYARKDYDNATEYYRRAIELNPKNANTLVAYARLMDINKDYEQAENFFQKAIKIDPRNVYALYYYANLLNFQRHDYDKAEDLYKRAIALNPEPNIMSTLLSCYAVILADIRKDHDRAEEFYLRAIETNPHDSYSLHSYASYLCFMEDYDKADEYFRRALEAEPNNPAILHNYADFLSNERKDYNHAEEFFKRAIEASPSNTHYMGGYAFFLMDIKKDYDKAEDFFKRAADLEPDNPRYIGYYALFLADGREDFNHAEELYKKAIKLNPKDPFNLANYAEFLITRGSINEAKAMITQALEYNQGQDNLALDLLLWFYRYAVFYQDFPDAEAAIESLLAKGVTSDESGLKNVLEVAKKRGHPDCGKLSQFEMRITDTST